ncbi:Rieske 2Fe-2S domain-containing protein [Klebsiella pneumoniae]|uniref:Rieske 2Fe-2S domain-containing protein n=1 Tax=Klebsiella pneumoniae TaxID=573 RepID=UPI002543BA85|nr:Rieske 2Fe-2S domain-containing protein [Klebsiella pneumoniae]
MQKTLSTLKDKINNALVVDRENHIYRCHRSIFTDPQLFEFEMKHIFEGNWVFLAHESQIPQPGDYYTLTLGRQPVIITRDKKNELHALINSCAHPRRHVMSTQNREIKIRLPVRFTAGPSAITANY